MKSGTFEIISIKEVNDKREWLKHHISNVKFKPCR